VKPTAPQIDTKSPKNGIAAETTVIAAMYAEVYVSRHRQDPQLLFFARTRSSKCANVGLQYILVQKYSYLMVVARNCRWK
jgi:hypothetical protein